MATSLPWQTCSIVPPTISNAEHGERACLPPAPPAGPDPASYAHPPTYPDHYTEVYGLEEDPSSSSTPLTTFPGLQAAVVAPIFPATLAPAPSLTPLEQPASEASPAPRPARRGRPPKPGSRGSKRRARLAAQEAQQAAAAAAQAEKDRAAAEAVRALEAIGPQSGRTADGFADGFPRPRDIDPDLALGDVLGQLAHTAQSAARFLHRNAPSAGEVSAALATQAAEDTLHDELAPRSKPGRKPLTDVPREKRTAQNRASQRAFRERRQAHLQSLEAKVERYEQERAHLAEALTFLATMVARQQPRCVSLERELARLTERDRSSQHETQPPPSDMDDRELPPLRCTNASLPHIAPSPFDRNLPLLVPLRRRRFSPPHPGEGKKPKLWAVSQRRPMLGAWGSAPPPCLSSAGTSVVSGPSAAARTPYTLSLGAPAGPPPPEHSSGRSGPGSGAPSSASASVRSGPSVASSGSRSAMSVRVGSVEPGWGA